MAFKDFKTITEVCKKFNCDVTQAHFIKEKTIKIDDFFFKYIEDNLQNASSFLNEYVICEDIIKPIIKIVANENDLPIWSHIPLNVTDELCGVPDYIFALAYPGNQEYKLPIACLGEAKKDDFVQGWGQTGAEMVAAQIANKNKTVPIFGLVTNGKFWEFGRLEGDKLTIEKQAVSTTDDLQKVLNILNWFFCEAKKSANTLLEIEKGEKK